MKLLRQERRHSSWKTGQKFSAKQCQRLVDDNAKRPQKVISAQGGNTSIWVKRCTYFFHWIISSPFFSSLQKMIYKVKISCLNIDCLYLYIKYRKAFNVDFPVTKASKFHYFNSFYFLEFCLYCISYLKMLLKSCKNLLKSLHCFNAVSIITTVVRCCTHLEVLK